MFRIYGDLFINRVSTPSFSRYLRTPDKEVLIVHGASGFCCWSADATKTTIHPTSHVMVVVLSLSVRWCHSSGIRGSVPILAVTANHRFSAVECVRAVLALVECRYK